LNFLSGHWERGPGKVCECWLTYFWARVWCILLGSRSLPPSDTFSSLPSPRKSKRICEGCSTLHLPDGEDIACNKELRNDLQGGACHSVESCCHNRYGDPMAVGNNGVVDN
jgi:hypothetical protein